MNETVARFLEHAKTESPGFECFDCHDDDEKVAYVAPVCNLLQEGAYSEMLDKLRKWLDDPGGQFADFYTAVDGAMLYVGDDKTSQGLHFCSLFEWEYQTHQMRKNYLVNADEFTDDIQFLTDSWAFAVVPASSNYFTVISRGDKAGPIYYVDHDAWSYTPFARNLNELLERIVAEPAQFLNDIGCYTRYSDGKTNTQWVPKRYLTDISEAAP